VNELVAGVPICCEFCQGTNLRHGRNHAEAPRPIRAR
jgi:hypothetical protein